MKRMPLCLVAVLMVGLFSETITIAEETPFRAAWVSTVYQLDYPSQATAKEDVLKQDALTMIQRAKEMGLNALILQVRPSSDAIYPSSIFPWSKHLTGSQDISPENGFDPLDFWVQQAHAVGIELHAWVNPYRITTGKKAEWESLAQTHPAKVHPDWVIVYEENYYWDPGLPQVRQMVLDGVLEIVNRYDVDGIHLDDYFYPGQDFADERTFAAYGNGFSNIEDWRRENVNQLIQLLDSQLHSVKPDIRFGISPAGIWANQDSLPQGSETNGNQSYFSHYADSRKWVQWGWVDYICPQLYWPIGHELADYEVLARWWSQTVQGTEVDLYIGMADYQAGNTDPASPWYGISALRSQHILNKTLPQVKGEVHFRFASLIQVPGLANYYATVYTAESQRPIKLNKEEHMAYIQGTGYSFEPNEWVTRAQVAVIFTRLSQREDGTPLLDKQGKYQSSFADVDRQAWYAEAVGVMEQYGIINGFQDGSFRPQEPVSRAQLIAIAMRFEDQIPDAVSPFPDVPDDYWAKDAIAYAVQQGWVNGYPEGTFLPEHPVTRAEAVKIINRLLERNPDDDYIKSQAFTLPFGDVNRTHWAYAEIAEAAVAHSYIREGETETWTGIQ